MPNAKRFVRIIGARVFVINSFCQWAKSPALDSQAQKHQMTNLQEGRESLAQESELLSCYPAALQLFCSSPHHD